MNTADLLKQDAFDSLQPDYDKCNGCSGFVSDTEGCLCEGSVSICYRDNDILDMVSSVLQDQLIGISENNVDALRDSILDGDVEGIGNFILRNLY